VLYFSKLRIILVTLVSLFFVLLTISNFVKFESNYLNKKINLGLDLQGGSYLLLEIDNTPVIEQKLQNFSITITLWLVSGNAPLKSLLRKSYSKPRVFFNSCLWEKVFPHTLTRTNPIK